MTFSIAIDSRFEDLSLVSKALHAWGDATVAPENMIPIEIGLTEVINNVIEHAYCGEAGHRIQIHGCQRRLMLAFLVEDDGRPLPPDLGKETSLPTFTDEIDDLSEGGRGLWLVRQCFSRVIYKSQGGRNRALLCRRIRTDVP